ncbi:MAG: hypothetical protein JWQ04_1463 [Pedosphaera sp.]|nr:hypothetical protein [Pedosphaera sp.]
MSENEKQGIADEKESARKNQTEPAVMPGRPSDRLPHAQKPESKPPRKPGPSVDIGPGPGADVVATPPRRI